MAAHNHVDGNQAMNRVPVDQKAQGNGAVAEGGNPRARAEQMVDQLAEKVAHLTSVLGRKILWLGIRLREEAEDIWEEAQSIRRREKL